MNAKLFASHLAAAFIGAIVGHLVTIVAFIIDVI
jgi:hypothetical protein